MSQRRALWRSIELVVGAAFVCSTLAGPSGASSSSTLPRGTNSLVLTWRYGATGAPFGGRLGSLPFSGVSKESPRYSGQFDVTGSLGKTSFHLLLRPTRTKLTPPFGIVFAVSGSYGSRPLRGRATTTVNPTALSGKITFTGTVGSQSVTGSVPVNATDRNGVRGTVRID